MHHGGGVRDLGVQVSECFALFVLNQIPDIDLGVDWDLVSPFAVETQVEIVEVSVDGFRSFSPLDLDSVINSSRLPTPGLADIVAPLIRHLLSQSFASLLFSVRGWHWFDGVTACQYSSQVLGPEATISWAQSRL